MCFPLLSLDLGMQPHPGHLNVQVSRTAIIGETFLLPRQRGHRWHPCKATFWVVLNLRQSRESKAES